MNSEAFLQVALNALSCSQKELASHLNVSPTQISKWKKGEHMSLEMRNKLRMIANISDKDPSFVLWAGSIEDAEKWEKLIRHLACLADMACETGYITYPLQDGEGILCWETAQLLCEIGVAAPQGFPKELDFDYEADNVDEAWNLFDENAYCSLISKIYNALNDVYGFYAAYLADLINDAELDLRDTAACNIEACLMSLATAKIEETPEFAPKLREFKRRIKTEYGEWLAIVKDKAFRAGVPLRAELLGLVYNSSDELGHEAEAESLKFNASRVHPDIYMNELLVGMRVIHQVLPAIMKKLGIEDEFEVNSDDLRIG